MSDDESKSSNENYSLILNFQGVYRNIGSQILWTLILSILLIVTVHQFFIIELIPLKDSLTAMTIISIPFMYAFPVTLIMFTTIFGIHYLKKRKATKKGFAKVQSALVRRAYILNFELEESEGVSQTDKIFNHLSLVFPQINQIKKKRLKKGYTNIDQLPKSMLKRWLRKNRVFRYVYGEFDLSVNTPSGMFLVKITNEKVLTFEDIESTVKEIRKKMKITGLGIEAKGEIDRLIFLTKSFDETISKQELNEKMKNLKRDYQIDIIKEKEYGYSTIWIN
jgi:hypothetical protein